MKRGEGGRVLNQEDCIIYEVQCIQRPGNNPQFVFKIQEENLIQTQGEERGEQRENGEKKGWGGECERRKEGEESERGEKERENGE